MFLLGRNTAAVPDELVIGIQALQLEIHQQQGKVDRLRLKNRHKGNDQERPDPLGQATRAVVKPSKPGPRGGPIIVVKHRKLVTEDSVLSGQ